jgi:hypothetical protein
MFCALQGPPKIVRLHGHGRVVEPGDPEFPRLQIHFSELAGIRSIIVVELADIADSCGFGVPLFQYRGQREQHGAWARKIGPEAIKTYQRDNNQRSRDGLPGLSG